MCVYEDDISAQEAATQQGSWLSPKNVYEKRQKCNCKAAQAGQKGAYCIGMEHVALKKNHEFQRVYKKGKSAAGRHMVLFLLKSNKATCRLGVSVSKKMGHAVARNRIRRRLKEAFRTLDAKALWGCDIVILPRAPIAGADFPALKSEMLHLLRKHGAVLQTRGQQEGDA